MTLDDLDRRARAHRRVLDAKAGELRSLQVRVEELRIEIADLGTDAETWDRVTVLLNSIGEEEQQRAQATIEALVTRGLQTIFGPTLSFHILQSVRAKSTVAEFVVRTTHGVDDVVETPVLDARGGGMAAVIGFLLRVVVMLLTGRESFLVLDESFAMVSEDYLEPLGDFLRELVERTGIQVLMVTHQAELVPFADRAYRFTQDAGITVVAEHG